jgi:hypothetical protein
MPARFAPSGPRCARRRRRLWAAAPAASRRARPAAERRPPRRRERHQPAAPAASAAAGATAWVLGEPCGALECGRFATPEAAFEAVLAPSALVLAIGETHARPGRRDPSSTARFTSALLPLLGGRASDLVLELWVADGRCGQREPGSRGAESRSTAPARDEPERVRAARPTGERVGVRPHVLRPSCGTTTASSPREGR